MPLVARVRISPVVRAATGERMQLAVCLEPLAVSVSPARCDTQLVAVTGVAVKDSAVARSNECSFHLSLSRHYRMDRSWLRVPLPRRVRSKGSTRPARQLRVQTSCPTTHGSSSEVACPGVNSGYDRAFARDGPTGAPGRRALGSGGAGLRERKRKRHDREQRAARQPPGQRKRRHRLSGAVGQGLPLGGHTSRRIGTVFALGVESL